MTSFLGLTLLMAPTLWAIYDALRRPKDGFRTGNRPLWLVVLLIGSATPFMLLVPFLYLVMVRAPRRLLAPGHEDRGRRWGKRRRSGPNPDHPITTP